MRKNAVTFITAFLVVVASCVFILGFSNKDSSRLEELADRLDGISDTLRITATDLYHAQIVNTMSRWHIKNFVTDSVGIDTFAFRTPEDIVIADGRKFRSHVGAMIVSIVPDGIPPGLDQSIFLSFASDPSEEVCIVEGRPLILSPGFQDIILFRAGINRDVKFTVMFKKIMEMR